MMWYGGYGGFGFLGMIFNIIIFVAIIWVVASLFNRHSGGEYDSRVSRIEREMEHNRETLDKILRKLE